MSTKIDIYPPFPGAQLQQNAEDDARRRYEPIADAVAALLPERVTAGQTDITIVIDTGGTYLEITPDTSVEHVIRVIHPDEIESLTGGDQRCWSITLSERGDAAMTVLDYEDTDAVEEIAKRVERLILASVG